jgi:hypothetical protein
MPIKQRTEPIIAELLSKEWKAKNSEDYSLNHDSLGSRDSAAIAYDTSRLCTGTEGEFVVLSTHKSPLYTDSHATF